MENVLVFVNNLFLFFLFYTFFCGIVSLISLWKIFTKERIPAHYSLIPFYNVYIYFKICSLPFWLIFVPIINIIALFCSTYIITRKYRCKRWQSILSIFFPFIFLPYIAFSDKRNIDFVIDNLYVKNMTDIDELEKELENHHYDEASYDYINSNSNKDTATEDDHFINNIENYIVSDEYIFDESDEIAEQTVAVPSIDDFDNNDFIEIDDSINIDNLSLEKVDELEKKLEVEVKTEKKVETNIQEYKEVDASKEAIAFGGQQKREGIDSVQTKNNDLKCTRCGSSLVGANGFCPGCGAKI